MRSISILTPDHFVSMAWKNGLGHTVELVKKNLPESSSEEGDFVWRLSMADVVTDGQFSKFDGYQRTLLLLEGSGMTLECSDKSRFELSEPLQIARFSGDDETYATLHDEPIKDFNIMTMRKHCTSSVEAVRKLNGTQLHVNCDELFVYVVKQDLTILFESGHLQTVPENHLLHIASPQSEKLVLSDAPCIVIQIKYCSS